MPVKKKRSFKSTILKAVAPTNMGSVAKDPRAGFTPAPSNVFKPPDAQFDYTDPTYTGEMAQAALPYNRALGRLGGDVGTLASDFGYTYDPTAFTPVVDATPGPGDDPNDPRFQAHLPGLAPGQSVITGIDTSNPYSRAALLQKSWDNSKASNTLSYGSHGQGFSGAYGVAQRGAENQFNIGSENLRRSFNDVILGHLSNVGDLGAQYGADRTVGLGGLTQRSAANPAPAPTAPAPPMPVGPTTTAGQVAGFKTMGIPSGTPVFTGAKGRFFKQPAVGGGTWHIYEDGHRVLVKGSKP